MTKVFIPHKYQSLAIGHMTSRQRSNLFMSPGMGKSSCTMTTLDICNLVEDVYPALVVGPLRVANSVWTRECDKWAHLNKLRVSKVLGTLTDRTMALARRAEIYTINYDNLDWLRNYFDGKPWPFKTIIADECFAAGTPVTTPHGEQAIETVEAGDLVLTHLGYRRVTKTWKKTAQRLVRLTLSNGVQIDATPDHPFFTSAGWCPAHLSTGATLYSSDGVRALQRGVRASVYPGELQEQARYAAVLLSILPHQALVRDATGYGGDEPREHAESRQAWLEQGAGLVGGNPQADQCRQEGSSPSDAGGQRQDISYGSEGSGSDPGRLYLELHRKVGERGARLSVALQARLWQSDYESWVGGGRLQSQRDSTSIAGSEEDGLLGVVRVDYLPRDEQAGGISVYDLEVEEAHTFYAGGVLVHNCTRIKNHRCSLQKSSTGKVFMKRGGGVNASALMLKASQSPRYHNLTGTPAPNGLQDLWGQQFPIDFGATLGQSYTAFTTRWFRQKPGSQREQAIFEPLDHAESEITRRIAPSTISLDAYDWFDVEKPREVDIAIELTDKLKAQYKTLHQDAVLKLSDEATITAVNAGVITAKCLQFASGSVFDENSVPHNVHDLKLQALDSLRENLCGAPLLVAYHWKPDREKILKKFKDAVVLPSGSQQKVVEDLWNAGKIPMLLVHPQSAGHGLDLQHGGHNLCMYSLQWDLELYQQVIERIGPVRQKQAGYDRLVNVYRLITVGTFDSTVAMRLKTKCSVQDAVTQAVRG